MGFIFKSLIRLQGSLLKRSLDGSCRDTCEAQGNFLLKILNDNRFSLYGKEHGFESIKSERDFRRSVPVNRYRDLEPYIEKIIGGQKNILTEKTPVIFNLTSGTGDKPKYIPVTRKTKSTTALLARQWLYRTLLDHPRFLNRKIFLITSPAIEGYTPSGIPFGSLSGLIYKSMPRGVVGSYVLPFIVPEIKNYDLRYYAMARLALEKDVSFIATPNPTTLFKIAETGIRYQEAIIRSIHDGCLFSSPHFETNDADSQITGALNTSLAPDHERARFLGEVIRREGKLLPAHCWPSLELIGCWLGGSVGYHAEKLSTWYGNVTKRDIGYLASEGCFTIPYEDSTPAGILALQGNYYEFLPEETAKGESMQALGAHELETGKLYRILITNESGLYRYDINDTVRIEKYYNGAPVLSFIRKTGDMLNITGEKLHSSQLVMAFEKIKKDFQVNILQFRAVENREKLRHDLLILLSREVPVDILGNRVLPAIDGYLCEINIEYAQKRRSNRLNPPCLYIMENNWEDETKKEQVTVSGRDFQYKWRQVCPEITETDKKFIRCTVEMREG